MSNICLATTMLPSAKERLVLPSTILNCQLPCLFSGWFLVCTSVNCQLSCLFSGWFPVCTILNCQLSCLFSGWFRAILPKSALRVEEEAWNAYPYTKTRYRCPFVEKFLLEIETRYCSDCCEEDNIFNLKKSELAQREVGGSLLCLLPRSRCRCEIEPNMLSFS